MAQQTINLGSAPDDGTGDTLRAGGDKINDNFDELYDETLKLKGSTDCSTNPNYPAASKADSYRVSVAGKIGGASGIDVEIGDFYYALADNAGGTQAAVGSSWDVLQGNTTGTGGSVDVEDEGVAVAAATVLNFTGAGVVATDAGGGQVDVTIAGGGGGVDIEDEGVAEATGATVLNFIGAGVTATDVGAGQVDIDIPGGGGSFRGALVKKAVDQTTANYTTVTALAWDSETGGYDTDTIHDNSTNPSRLTTPVGSTKVRLQAAVSITSSTNDTWNLLEIRKGGSADFIGVGIQRVEIGSTGGYISCATAVVTVTGGTDYFEAFFQTESDTSITIEEERSWFSMEIIE